MPLFQGLSNEELQSVTDAFEARVFEPEAEIVPWGSKGGDLHIIQSGEACFSVPQQVYALHTPGEFFGDQLLTKRHIASPHRITAGNTPLFTVCLSQAKFDALDLQRRTRQKHKKRNSKVLGKRGGATHAVDEEGGFSPPSSPARSYREAPARTAGPLSARAIDREKGAEDVKLILDGVKENAHLMEVLQPTDAQIQIIAEQVVWVSVPANTFLYREGEICDSLFVIHDGLFEVLERGRIVQKLRGGQSFGELGLLYGSKSKQSVRAARDSVVWELGHESFRDVLKTKSTSRLEEYVQILRKASVFSCLSDFGRGVLADSLEEAFFKLDEQVLAEGDFVQKLYIVFEGTLEVDRAGAGVGTQALTRGDIFGLEQMAQDQPQPWTIRVTSDTAMLLTLDKEALEVLADMTVSDMASRIDNEDEECQQGEAMKHCDSLEVFQRRQSTPVEFEVIPKEQLRRVGVLGAGSFGFVTLEEDVASGKQYALKAMSKGYCVQEGMQSATLREKQIHMMLHSPFIVRLYATYKDSDYLYFLLQPAVGGDLFEVCADHEDWFGSAEHARFFSGGLSLGLGHMHDKRIIYRDIKLENVLLDHRGYPLLADMGLAKIVCGKTYTVCGTADYMAPETLRRTGHDRAVDWWAMGIFIFIMMSGRSPFDASEAAQIYRNIVKGLKKEHYPDSFDRPLRDLVGGLCKKRPEERLAMGPRGLAHLQEAPWFQSFDWCAMAAQTLPPPWVPPPRSLAELASHRVELPPVVAYVEDGSNWDADF